jgi:Family of unknown function (DUF6498)
MSSDGKLLRELSDYKTSAYVLIAANVLPLFGVLFLGWDTFSIVALYWTENVIIGAINVLKMITCNPDMAAIYAHKFNKDGRTDGDLADKYASTARSAQFANQASKFFLVPFFIVHYGLFCLVHGIFVFVLFGHESFNKFGFFGPVSNITEVFSQERMWWCVIALAASHLWSFFVNYLGRGENRRTVVIVLMMQPYARIVVLHIAVIIGGFVSMALGSNVGILMILIAGKTLLDLSLHLNERIKNDVVQAPQPPILPDVITGGTAESLPMPATTAQPHPPVHSSSGD